MNAERKIIHVDMDAFFASVEQRDRPELRGLPVAVGHDAARGVVATASYEARRYGVHSAMPMARAKMLCPNLVVVPGRYDAYKKVSLRIRSIFADYTDCIEPLSLDEAFLDVTHNKVGAELGVDIAREIRRRIRAELNLTASAGVSYCKFLAKVASDCRKPDGMTVIHPSRALDFIAGLRIEQFWGVGPRTAVRMHRMGIHTGADLRQASPGHLVEVFGKAGSMYHDFSLGIDPRPVVAEHVRKSVGCEHTLEKDITRPMAALIELYHTVLELAERLAADGFEGRTLTLKVKYADFTQITRSVTVNAPLVAKDDILPHAKRLLAAVECSEARPVRLIGLTVSNPASGHSAARAVWVQGVLPFEP